MKHKIKKGGIYKALGPKEGDDTLHFQDGIWVETEAGRVKLLPGEYEVVKENKDDGAK